MNVKQQVDNFIADTILRECTKSTAYCYEVVLRELIAFCKRNKIEDLNDFTTPLLVELLNERKKKSGIYQFQVVLKILFNYLIKVELVKKSPIFLKVRQTSKRPVYYSLAVINELRKHIPNPRDKVIYDLITQTGLRVSEALNLKKEDVNWNSGAIVVKNTKGRADRIVFAPKKTIDNMLMLSPKNNIYVFTTSNGKPIYRWFFWQKIKKAGDKLGIRVFPHALRHSFATMFDREMRDPRALQVILGHKDLKTTEKYTHLSGIDIQENMNKYQAEMRRKKVKYVSSEDI